MRVYCETYGCTMNRGDTELILGCLMEGGHAIVSRPVDAEVIIVNTCAVKGPTQRRVLRRLSELLTHNSKRVVVAGCLPLIDPNSIERLGTFDGMISCHSTWAISDVLERIARGEKNVRRLQRVPCEKPCMPKLRSSKVSAIVPIAEGCLSNCSYCSVRFARGRLHSFRPENILREVKGVLRSGYCEILLTTQDTAAYGLDLNMNLPELLNSITALEGEFKIRVGMMNPANAKRILPELLKAYESEKIYKFLHLPVQSGDDRVLATMRRGYTVKDFLRIVRAFRQKFPNLYLATDAIVGFPGESEEEFMRTCELIEKVKPDKTNVSRFSPLPGTDAARMPQLDGREIARRSRVMSELCRRITYEQNRLYVRQTVRGLVTERGWKGGYIVRLPNYKLAILQNAGLGDFINVKITAAKPTYLLAEKVN